MVKCSSTLLNQSFEKVPFQRKYSPFFAVHGKKWTDPFLILSIRPFVELPDNCQLWSAGPLYISSLPIEADSQPITLNVPESIALSLSHRLQGTRMMYIGTFYFKDLLEFKTIPIQVSSTVLRAATPLLPDASGLARGPTWANNYVTHVIPYPPS